MANPGDSSTRYGPNRDFTGVRIIVTEGSWVNIKTDDDDIFATIFGYYVAAESTFVSN